MITSLVDQIKVISSDRSNLEHFKLECQELQEQLVEYKGLTQQLQEEKRSLNGKLQENLSSVESV